MFRLTKAAASGIVGPERECGPGTNLRRSGTARSGQCRVGTRKTMKRIEKALALLLTLSLALLLCTACAGKTPAATGAKNDAQTTAAPETTAAPAETQSKEISGRTAEWGAYTVLVPEGFELKEAGEFSYYDFSVEKSDFCYISFITEADNDTMMNKYNYNKDTYTNEQEDVEAVYGGNTWTGFQYSDGWGGYGFEAYTSLGEKLVRVSAVGYRFDSPEAQAVLGSFAAK